MKTTLKEHERRFRCNHCHKYIIRKCEPIFVDLEQIEDIFFKMAVVSAVFKMEEERK